MQSHVFELLKIYLARTEVPPGELPKLLRDMDNLFMEPGITPEVRIEDTVTDDYIICLEDGRRMKILKRHIQQTYGMTPDEYRKKWNLPSDYPMVAKNYGLTRSAIAKEQGLGKRSAA
jgi:predicted transcriptional regulator